MRIIIYSSHDEALELIKWKKSSNLEYAVPGISFIPLAVWKCFSDGCKVFPGDKGP